MSINSNVCWPASLCKAILDSIIAPAQVPKMLLICFILGHIPACWHNLNKVVLSPPGKIKPSRLLSDSLVLTSIKSIAKLQIERRVREFDIGRGGDEAVVSTEAL